MVSRSRTRLLAFFIGLTFGAGGSPRADESNLVASLRMRNDNQVVQRRDADQEVPVLALGVVWVLDGDRQRIGKRRRRFAKGDSVLALVTDGLPRVPETPAAAGAG